MGGGECDRSVGIAFKHVEPPHQVVGTLGGCYKYENIFLHKKHGRGY